MTTIHESEQIPTFTELWDFSDNEPIVFTWEDHVLGGSVTASSWTLPSGWTSSGTQLNVSVTDSKGTVHTNCNTNTLTYSGSAGTFTISNEATFSDGRILERSVRVKVDNI